MGTNCHINIHQAAVAAAAVVAAAVVVAAAEQHGPLTQATHPEPLLDAVNVVICAAFLPTEKPLLHHLLWAIQE